MTASERWRTTARESLPQEAPLETGHVGDAPDIVGLVREIERLRASRARLASAGDADRRDLERALHEGVQQDLVGLAANLEILSASIESDPAAARVLLEDLQVDVLRSLAEVRELATRLSPPLLDAGGIVPELRAAAGRAGVTARVSAELDGVLPPASAGALYFCALDVFERAPVGTPVEVSIRGSEGVLAFEVGVQCDLGEERRAPHDRIEALGGSVTITSGGDRTTVAGSLPSP